jgi:hypothetical protein
VTKQKNIAIKPGGRGSCFRRHDIQHNGTQHNDTQHNDTQLLCDFQHNDTAQLNPVSSAVMLFVVMQRHIFYCYAERHYAEQGILTEREVLMSLSSS